MKRATRKLFSALFSDLWDVVIEIVALTLLGWNLRLLVRFGPNRFLLRSAVWICNLAIPAERRQRLVSEITGGVNE